ncbi:hypothetical protein OA86_00760 [Kaistella jeonii]|uniref:Uncharacterized protein n=2 Tax=Kaistella jeonii TaxID=266749 RepID=A0A0C1FBH7_9FLAO|nr:hypothetical protein OA86_00760 [Kaistella jeonii]
MFLLVSVFNFGQTYDFDFLTKYKAHNSKNNYNFDSVNYFNTEDFSYYLKLSKDEKFLSAFLFDEKRKFVHYFKVTESNIKHEIQFEFLYEYSYPFIAEHRFENYHFEFSSISESSPKEITLKVFKSKKARKPVFEQTLTLQTANINLFEIYRKSILSYLHTADEISFPGNYIVKKVVEKHKDYICEIELVEYKNVELEIVLPEKLNLKNSYQAVNGTSLKFNH